MTLGKSDRTRAMEMFHQRNMPLDAIANRLGTTTERAREYVFGPPRKPLKRTTAQRRRQAISPASAPQRQKVKGEVCTVADCSVEDCAPAHLIDRSLWADRDGDPRRVIPLCAQHHREFDEGDLDLLPSLENGDRRELAYAVERFGLISTLHRVTNRRGGHG